ncbi:Gmad2 immunoglobulin-like domain-containing protein [Alkaliphilus serpentinus]|uniref:Protease complex subunit PrcB family protein n=1 Tax=Alkaliphilus serpentinus TaxID=1482731 RepID=A0A833HRU0_9FIRM|nr:Gmad2 immunoglobulin-like domain-containing protein [Alkaliphilus serpentinus]KAB3532470.1 protease complex subunit PrcB family protein [Alkaliphilus serpentinus]
MKLSRFGLIIMSLLIVSGCQIKDSPLPNQEEYPYSQLKAESIQDFQIYWDGEKSLKETHSNKTETLADLISKIPPINLEAKIDDPKCLRGIKLTLNREIEGSNQLLICLIDSEERIRLGPQGREYVVTSKELVEFIEDNRPQKLAILEEEHVPSNAMDWFKEFNRKEKAAYVYQHPNATFIRVDAGEKPTGGYDIEVKGYVEEEYPRRIHVEFTEPEEGQVVTEALIYPTVYLKVYTKEASRYDVIDQQKEILNTEEEFVYAVLETPLEDDKIDSNFRVKGRIIAFEGAFVIRILDAYDKVIHEEFLQADAGGPQWGAFDEKIIFQPPKDDTGFLEVGEFSAQNGIFLQRLRIPIRFEE